MKAQFTKRQFPCIGQSTVWYCTYHYNRYRNGGIRIKLPYVKYLTCTVQCIICSWEHYVSDIGTEERINLVDPAVKWIHITNIQSALIWPWWYKIYTVPEFLAPNDGAGHPQLLPHSSHFCHEGVRVHLIGRRVHNPAEKINQSARDEPGPSGTQADLV